MPLNDDTFVAITAEHIYAAFDPCADGLRFVRDRVEDYIDTPERLIDFLKTDDDARTEEFEWLIRRLADDVTDLHTILTIEHMEAVAALICDAHGINPAPEIAHRIDLLGRYAPEGPYGPRPYYYLEMWGTMCTSNKRYWFMRMLCSARWHLFPPVVVEILDQVLDQVLVAVCGFFKAIGPASSFAVQRFLDSEDDDADDDDDDDDDDE